MTDSVEVRCPNPPKKLFAKLVKAQSTNTLIEFACADCAKSLRKVGKDVFRVLHRYETDGSLVETLVTYWDDIVNR